MFSISLSRNKKIPDRHTVSKGLSLIDTDYKQAALFISANQ